MLFMWRRRTHQNCPKEDLVEFLIVEVEYDPQEIEALIGMEKKSRKRNRLDSRNNTVSTKKDLSHITCFRYKDLGHYFSGCPKRKTMTQGGHVITRKPRDLSEVICFCCNEAGHFARDCPNEKETCAKQLSQKTNIVVVVVGTILLY